MAGKDISDMSFDEFFLGKKSKKSEPSKPAAAEVEKTKEGPEVDASGFKRGKPRLGIRGDSVFIYVPKYSGKKGSKYAVTAEQDGKEIPLGNLKVSPLDSDGSSLPTELDLLGPGVRPLDRFVLRIDGVPVHEVFEHTHQLFGENGVLITRAEDNTIVLYRKGKHLWLTDAKLVTTQEVGDLVIATTEVAAGGFVKVKDKPRPVPKEEVEAKPEKKAPAKKEKPSASISLPTPETVAEAVTDKGNVPIYTSFPTPAFKVKGSDSFAVRIASADAEQEVPLSEFDLRQLPEVKGIVTISVVNDGKVMASERFCVIPGFSCSYDGKGEIPSSEEVSFTLDGSEYTGNIYEGMEGPYPLGGSEVKLSWNIPAVTIDVGKGEMSFGDIDVNVDDLGQSVIVTVKGAAKKGVFMGGVGKKVSLTPDWIGDTVRIDSTPISEAVFSSPTREVSLFITVNSCPMRRFATITNEVGMTVSYSDGAVRATIRGTAGHVCRVYNLDKSVDTVELTEGENVIPVGPGAISAEVAEIRNGEEIAVESVTIKELPFLLRDSMGDVWLHVSKDKRIPLPDGLLEKSKDPQEVRKWHGLIVRMNPELRAITPERMVEAFKTFEN